MVKELEQEGQKAAAAEDPWQPGEGDPWNAVKKTHEGLKVSDSPVSEEDKTE